MLTGALLDFKTFTHGKHPLFILNRDIYYHCPYCGSKNVPDWSSPLASSDNDYGYSLLQLATFDILINHHHLPLVWPSYEREIIGGSLITCPLFPYS